MVETTGVVGGLSDWVLGGQLAFGGGYYLIWLFELENKHVCSLSRKED
jgi:hypothetical protein